MITKNQLYLVLAVAFILRVITLGNYETWDDEKVSVTEANGISTYKFIPGVIFTNNEIKKNNTIRNVILSNVQDDGGNGVLYALSLHCWAGIFGNTDVFVRLLSVLLGILVVVLIYLLSIEMFNNKSLSIIISGLATIHPQLITYSQEARAYTLALVLTLSATLLLLKTIKQEKFKTDYLIYYALLTAAAILSHYSTIYIFIAHFFILVFLCKINLKNWLKLVGSGLIALLIVSLWFYKFGLAGLDIIANRNQHYSELTLANPTNSFYMKTGVYSIAAGWMQNILIFSGNTLMNLGCRILLIMPLLIIPIIIIVKGLKCGKSESPTSLKIIFILAISSLLYATILSLIAGHIIPFQQSYAIFSTPYFIILIGASIFWLLDSTQKNKKYTTNILILLQLSIMIVSFITIYFGFDSHTKTRNSFETMSAKISEITTSENEDLKIIYKEAKTAIEINKYLDKSLANVKQLIDTAGTSQLYLLFPNGRSQILVLGK